VWLIKVKNHQFAKLTRWILKLAENEFEVVNRPGKKHVNAGVLSRHVADAVRKQNDSHDNSNQGEGPREGVLLSKKVIRQAQAKDEFCQQTRQALSEGKIMPYFCDEDSVLYHESTDASGEPKIVFPVSLRERVIQQHHDLVFAGHQGDKRTLGSLRLYYYWPSMGKNVEHFIRGCESCATMKGGSIGSIA
jgi:hypothetical protein